MPESDERTTGIIELEVPNKFPGTSGAVCLPDNPEKWVADMQKSLQSEHGCASIVVEIVNDGGGAVGLTLCPYELRKTAGETRVDGIGNNLSLFLSNRNALMLGRTLIALAKLNPPL
jgi:hypothetical protein